MGVRVLLMRQSYRIIPIYTADVSGVCSALYELGGMTVMHDPSGCNSTYNTHDELRWYDQDSLIVPANFIMCIIGRIAAGWIVHHNHASQLIKCRTDT